MDRLPLVNVTARIQDQNGKPVVKARITMRLTTVERYCGLIVPRETSAYTDASGNAVLRVWPNELGTECSEYKVTISNADCGCVSPCGGTTGGAIAPLNRSFYAVVPNADCNLFDIANLPPYEQRGSGQVITAEVAAFSSQAANAAQSAENAVATIEAIRNESQTIANNANSAKTAAEEAARQAQKHEDRAKDYVDRVESRVTNFETSVIDRTEKTANRLIAQATTCIKESENVAMQAIEERAGCVLTDISTVGTTVRNDVLASIATARENATAEVQEEGHKVLEELREEAALFGEDFEALTERAEAAAKRSGCSAAAASNAATKACLCADRAEKAANGIEDALAEAERAAAAAKKEHACAHKDATCAENAATAAHIDAGKAEASEIAAEKSAQMADCCAKKACKCAELAGEIKGAIDEDKAYIDEAVPKVVQAIEEKEERLEALEARQDRAGNNLDALEVRMGGFESRVKKHAERAFHEASRAEDAADRAENMLTYVQGENIEMSWRLPAGADNGEILDLPAAYVVGLNSMRLSWGGMLLYQNVQYREVGEAGELSSKVRLLCDIGPNAAMNIHISGARVTGDLDAAEKKAAEIIASLEEARAQTDEAIANLEGTLNQIMDGGNIQVERAKKEADRAEKQASLVGQLVKVAQGANLQASWTTSGASPRDTLLTLPITYISGRSSLRLFYGGMLMSPGIHYEEIGGEDSISRHVKLLIELPDGSQMNAWSVATGASVDQIHEKLEQVQQLFERAQEAVRIAEEARDKALAAAEAAVTGMINTVPDFETIEKNNDGFSIVDPEMETDKP